MKKLVFCFALTACAVGCADDAEDQNASCGHGRMGDDGVCICDAGYKHNLSLVCKDCADGYSKNADGLCVKPGSDNGNDGNDGNNGNNGNNSGGSENDGNCAATFVYFNQYTNIGSGGTADFDVYIVGDFNDWQNAVGNADYKMTSDGNGTHTITLDVKKGSEYRYKFYVDGWADNSWQSDPANSSADEDGNAIAVFSKCGMQFGQGGSIEIGDNHIKSIARSGNSIVIALADGVSITGVSGGVNPQISGSTVTDAVTENNRYNYVIQTDKGEVYAPVWVEDSEFNWRDALLYFAFTDRFSDGDPSNNAPATDATHQGTSDARWMGGDFKGLQNKVEDGYFEKLGVNTLWISSVSMNTQETSIGTDNNVYSAYHSYWPITTFMTAENQSEFNGLSAIEPHFGSMTDLQNLVDACHKRGMRVLVDFAANHVHKSSPIYQKHQDWFNDAPNGRLCDNDNNWDNYSEKCWFSQDLPDIDYENSDARKLMVDHAVWLIKQTGIDGFRVDAVKHMNIQFIKDLRAAIETLFANTGITFYTVGETFTSDIGLLNKYIGNNLLHAQFDFPLYYRFQNILSDGNMSGVRGDGLSISPNSPFNSNLMGTFIGNHDVARALSVAAGQNQNKWGNNEDVNDWLPYFKVKQAMTIQLTQPGVPLIYYGDEYGMVGANDPDNRRMMKFSDYSSEQETMLAYVRQLGQIRASHKALTRGTRTDLDSTNGDKIWCYEMSYENEKIIVGVAASDGDGSCNLNGEKTLEDLLNPGSSKNASSLNFDGMSRFQIYRVK